MSIKLFVPCVFVAASLACAGKTPGPEGAAAPQQEAARGNRDVITAAELSKPELAAQSLLSVIRTLRPTFLVNRGLQSYSCGKSTDDCQADPDAGTVHVSVDNGRIVRVDELEAIHVVSVQEVRYLNPAAAMNKFGGAARSGPVILVTMKKGG